MDKRDKVFGWILIALVIIIIVAADNGVFDDTDYFGNAIYNLTDVNSTNAEVTTIRWSVDPANHNCYDNATCLICTGDTSALELC